MEPTTTDRISTPELESRLKRRRKVLVLLWSLTVLLLVGQAGAAFYSTTTKHVSTRQPALVKALASPDAGWPSRVPADATPPIDISVPAETEADLRVDMVRPRPTRIGRGHGKRGERHKRPPAVDHEEQTDDVKVPRKMRGSAAQGARIARMGCGLCHGRSAGPLNPKAMSARRWSRYFARGVHGRHTPLRNNFTRAELAHVKAYLMKASKEAR